MPRFPRTLLFLLAVVVAAASRPAAWQGEASPETARVRSIVVEGERRFSEEQILEALGMVPGEPINDGALDAGITRLWESSRVRTDEVRYQPVPGDDSLIDVYVLVHEMAVDFEPRFVGNKKIKLKKLLEWSNLSKESEVYLHEVPLIRRRIQRGYREEGYYWAEVEAVIGGPAPDVPDVIFEIREGPKVKVKNMKIHGGETFPEGGWWFWKTGLKELAEVKLSGPSKFLRLLPVYKTDELQADLIAMRQVFRDRGWVDAIVEVERLEWNAKKSRVTIHVRVDQGPRYVVSSVDLKAFEFEQDLEDPTRLVERPKAPLIPKEELLAMCELRTGSFFEQLIVRRDQDKLRSRYGEEGHIADSTLPQLDRWSFLDPELVYNRELRTVDVTYRVVEGRPIYIREVLFSGNLHTRDRVLRRELRVFPGEIANMDAIRDGLGRITSTGYFSNPQAPLAHTEPFFRFLDTSDPSWKDIEFVVEEGKVIQFNLSGGVGDAIGAFIQASVSISNFDATALPSSVFSTFSEIGKKEAFHGDGQSFSINVAPGTEVSQFGFNWSHPDIFGRHLDRISFAINGQRRFRIWDQYDERRDVFGFNFGRQLGLGRWVTAGYEWSEVRVSDLDTGGEPSIGNPLSVPLFLAQQEGDSNISHLSFAYSDSQLDNRVNPRRGYRANASAQVYDSILGADYDFLKMEVSGDAYGSFTSGDEIGHGWKARARFGVAPTYGDTTNVPYTERYFLGGARSLRGFSFRGVGPNQNGGPIGGETMLNGSIEYRIPLHTTVQPGTGREIEMIRGALFVDAGILDPEAFEIDTDELRASVGFSIGLTQPLPFVFSFGFPIADGAGDQKQVFNFELGF